ncbi:MAG TPA: alginate lyase family protein [Pyrinomonadaceae bacterium]|nr:alginate lyase family protein [Pyrinomonadaceae bacterium]
MPDFSGALRGEVTLRDAALEALRRGRVALGLRRERARRKRSAGAQRPPRLLPEFAALDPSQLLEHFRTRAAPRFFPGFEEAGVRASAEGSEELKREAEDIVTRRRWPLLGFGALEFTEEIDWLRDPVSGERWPLDFHADVRLVNASGGDVRVLWELNRLGHLLTLARAYAATADERYAAEMIRQALDWREKNPAGFGPNWACAMEAALRAMNLLAALRLVRRSPHLDEATLGALLSTLEEHGRHIRRNLEFSHIATSNHYLSDVAGLFWLGVLLPELAAARGWREFGLRELLREMGKQVLADGADCEASTGYHRLVAEIFLYSFLLARENGIDIEESYWRRLRSMLEYARSYLRPDGLAPLVGDADSGRVLAFGHRAADEHAYLLAVGAVVFKEPAFAVEPRAPEEVLWLLGREGVRAYESLAASRPRPPSSAAFESAGTYVMREGDLFMLFNASGAGLKGRGSHGHNDALALEVSAHGACFLRDPGTYVYTGDPEARHLFRSTAYHSTVEVDGEEQNTTHARLPFRIGDEARPRLLRWESTPARDRLVAEHRGYARLPKGPVTHRRSVVFDKAARLWLVEDTLEGAGRHAFRFVFHLAPGLAAVPADAALSICDKINGARLLILPLEGMAGLTLEPRHSSRDYGSREQSLAACWTMTAAPPLVRRWALVPCRPGEPEGPRLELAKTVARSL